MFCLKKSKRLSFFLLVFCGYLSLQSSDYSSSESSSNVCDEAGLRNRILTLESTLTSSLESSARKRIELEESSAWYAINLASCLSHYKYSCSRLKAAKRSLEDIKTQNSTGDIRVEQLTQFCERDSVRLQEVRDLLKTLTIEQFERDLLIAEMV